MCAKDRAFYLVAANGVGVPRAACGCGRVVMPGSADWINADAVFAVRPAAAPARRSRVVRRDVLVVLAVAVAVRLLFTVRSSGGFAGDVGYDQSVYFTAADAFTYGRMPYSDFVLLHPPGIMLALTPFAWAARLVGDSPAFIAANVASAVLGAVNATLVTRIATNWRLARSAALCGGLFYATWSSAAGPEISARLEPLATFAFLIALLALSRHVRPSAPSAVVAGAALGFSTAVKIWWIVPLVICIGWYGLRRRDPRVARLIAGGAVASLALTVGPFFVHSPGQTWRMVVADQIGRPRAHSSPVKRLLRISSLHVPALPSLAAAVLVLVLAMAFVVLAAAAWRCVRARLVVVIAVAQLLVLLASPSFYAYYAGFAASATALVVAAAMAGPWRDAHRRLPKGVAISVMTVAALVTATSLVTGRGVETSHRLAVGYVRQQVRNVPCLVADAPMALIAVDALSRGLEHGCPNWGDVSGRTYDVDRSARDPGSRTKNVKWQRDVLAYLTSGQAVVVIRKATGLDAATRAALQALPVIAQGGRLTVRAVDTTSRSG